MKNEMQIEYAVVPPGGGEIEYSFKADMEALPVPGDYVFRRDHKKGAPLSYATFIVRRRWFWPQESRVVVEVEPARSSHESDAHAQMCERYGSRGKEPQQLQDSCY